MMGSIEATLAHVAGVDVTCVRSGVPGTRRLDTTADPGDVLRYYIVTVPSGVDSREIIRRLETSDLFQIVDLWTTLIPLSEITANTSAEALAFDDLEPVQASLSGVTLLAALLVLFAILCGGVGVCFLRRWCYASRSSEVAAHRSVNAEQCCFPLPGGVPRPPSSAEAAQNNMATSSWRGCTSPSGQSVKGVVQEERMQVHGSRQAEAPMQVHNLQQAAVAEGDFDPNRPWSLCLEIKDADVDSSDEEGVTCDWSPKPRCNAPLAGPARLLESCSSANFDGDVISESAHARTCRPTYKL